MKKPDADEGPSVAPQISERIAELHDWRGNTLARMRTLVDESAFKTLVLQAVALSTAGGSKTSKKAP